MFSVSAGLSDPFCVVRVNNAKKFKTNVAYETLAPVWNESVSIAMPQAGDKINLVSSTWLLKVTPDLRGCPPVTAGKKFVCAPF